MHGVGIVIFLAWASITFAQGAESAPSKLRLEIIPEGYSEEDARFLAQSALEQSFPASELAQGGEVRYRMLRSYLDARHYELDVYDYRDDRLLRVSGVLGRPGSVRVAPAPENLPTPPPTQEEFSEAIAILGNDPELGPRAREWLAYPSMPGIVQADFTGSRVITVGLLPQPGSALRHQIVGVNLGRRAVVRFTGGAPRSTIATARVCAPPDAGQAVSARGAEGRAKIVAKRGNETIWTFTVIRPSASSGFWGSGIEVRDVTYRGKKVLSRANVPILNVRYNGDVCGPFRDWGYAESAFRAKGSLIASGILQASSSEPPKTIFESGSDLGNFRGVAIYEDGPETVVVSETEAEWYRYRTEFRFHEDGTIRPSWGFSGVQSSCTCHAHHHHAYFRLDFDLGDGDHNSVEVSDGTIWKPVLREAKFYRNSSHKAWRILEPATGAICEIHPGSDDGTAAGDRYAQGDVWALHWNEGEMDDSMNYLGTIANLDGFLSGESLVNQDVVIWYGAHFLHVSDDPDALHDNKILGPTLKLSGW